VRGNSINFVSPNSMFLCKNVPVFYVVLCKKINTFSITVHIEVYVVHFIFDTYIYSVILDIAISSSIRAEQICHLICGSKFKRTILRMVRTKLTSS